MQYILTEQEYKDLKTIQTTAKLENTKKLQTLCSLIADKMPVDWTWGEPGEKPWGCILTRDKVYEWYCDQCPVRDICPYPNKHYSK
jgi:hypothetical protein